jgi:tripartite-type tricarboxylate transporter receptor subunit TctC
MSLRHTFASTLLGLCLIAGTTDRTAAEANYPTRPITLIVPFAAGGPTDVVARIIGQHMAGSLGQPIMIENVAGTGGTIAAIRTKRATPDGYTVIIGHLGTHAAAVAVYPNLAYDPSTDFEPIGMVAGTPVLILARKDFPPNDLAAFASYAKANGTRMAHAGIGSVSYSYCLFLNNMIGATPEFTAFNGTGPAMKALAAGQVDYMCDQIVTAVPQVKAQAIKAYAIGTEERSPVLPGVPTSGEAGLPQFRGSAWNALFAPKGTPKAIVDRLNAALARALDDDGTRAQLLALGSVLPQGDARSPQALAVLVKHEIARWSGILQPLAR